MKGKPLYLKLHTDSASSGGNRGVSTRIADKGAMKPFLEEPKVVGLLSILVIFKQPQKGGKNVKRFDRVSLITMPHDITIYFNYPNDEVANLSWDDLTSIQIVPQPQGVKKDG